MQSYAGQVLNGKPVILDKIKPAYPLDYGSGDLSTNCLYVVGGTSIAFSSKR
jgi:hypothetical protein